jgi:hypothetical protein
MEHFTWLLAKEVFVAIAAFVGMILGIKNYLNEKSKSKVLLKVIPKSVVYKGKGPDEKDLLTLNENKFEPHRSNNLFAIQVVNLSRFPVFIDDVGFWEIASSSKFTIPFPMLCSKTSLPKKLEERESVVFYGNILDVKNISKEIDSVYVETSCGYRQEASSGALLGLNRYIVESA